ncbi:MULTISPECIES: 2-keto-4-pentenoate hydratase [unclassified Burkholderia]|uniref:2-keto-4-pentenoate hydratase n=1 Tax=unclassified Burkholderia TaxID=2613784 RepID=UPI000F57CC79|nr:MULTISPECIES: fumarylacetoacetate hydrolase family protein [unclassified Burkholderia]RQR68771.1 2-keto-4-pentenoate hydratase [Burkholderia sp. Bp9012]RQR70277.1 2-keto-4-pentenoate hydratase [Burkholderia sp. Bp9011]RQR83023.1 2-keto-4-pentenoate hydratase [Burkholderia sp. Bp9010]RQZ39432.1 2-keto-4-pentenoate hydratase [Burkholderia sp. Bp9099]
MNEQRIEQAAVALREARAARRTIPRISEQFDIAGVEAAYAVAEINTRAAVEAGRRIVGKKIGLTSKSVQQQLGVDQPDFGVLFDDMEYLSGAAVPAARLVQPKAEAEVAFVMGHDLNDDVISWGRFLRTIEFALPAIEIVDSVIHDWKITFVDTIADNASCGVYVLGDTPRRIGELDLVACPMRCTVNDVRVSEGAGAGSLGNPLYAAWWLAKELATHGQVLRAGDVVLSGALGPMVAVAPRASIAVEIGGLGAVFCELV